MNGTDESFGEGKRGVTRNVYRKLVGAKGLKGPKLICCLLCASIHNFYIKKSYYYLLRYYVN